MAVHSAESRLLVIMTGGTICMRPSPEGLVPAKGFLDAGMAPRPSFNDGSEPVEISAYSETGASVALSTLRTPQSRYERHVRYAVLEFKQLLDSSSIDAKGWSQIAKTIGLNYAAFDGFVVLHGTDSLAYTASALSFMLEDLAKPVIFTGSQAPIFELQTDATDNLLDSLIIAGHFWIPEVCICFQHKLFRGNRCTKISANHFDAFASPNLAPLATVTSSQINVDWTVIRQRPSNHGKTDSSTHLKVRPDLDTTHVASLRIFPGILPAMIDAVLRLPTLRGLVLETFGAGNAPSGQDNALITIFTEAVERGIVIVNVTQCLTGSVSPTYAPAMVLGRAGIVPGFDLTTEAALTKLSFLLAVHGEDVEGAKRGMALDLRGELSVGGAVEFGAQSPVLMKKLSLGQ
ncbi:hypothetical protein LTR78_003440 [Recurvomyces mirabilis]|uniref:asparaginase n=1 Tax=Recurvomyces mirabilis TaxID=574656 RepID=A0AAE0WRX0_9PEZI|nr:hypothetical protein LTR78_003440 [Recurvomyces mirabilis]KAK5154526.1 hypothetical protein LTS14_006663 [Recurvomyces mirabilis]